MKSAPLADREAVSRMRAGDASGLDEVYQRYARPVYSLALRILREPSAAEDLTQDVFLKLWRQPETYDADRGALSAWLLSVAHNRAVDLIRRRRVRDEEPLSESHGAAEVLRDGLVDPSELAGLQETAVAVRRALTQIPNEQRRAIEMAFFQGKTHVEIAAELGEPLGTTKTRIRLGMRKMRALLDAEGVTS